MSKAKQESKELNHTVRTEMARHSVNCSEVLISASHGVVHLYGRVRPLRGHEANFEADIGTLLKALRQRSGVRDVIAEWTCVF